MAKWNYFFYCHQSESIQYLVSPKAEERSLFYLRKKVFEVLTKSLISEPDQLNILFLDTERDLDSNSCLDCIANTFGNPDKIDGLEPVLIIGTEPIIDNDNEFDRRKAFLDSSIWFRYIHKLEKTHLEKVISFFKAKEELYKTNVAKEYASFYSGLLPASKLRIKGAHATCVSPFIFHSESKMKELAETPGLNKQSLSLIDRVTEAGLRWRILLADDYASKNLAPFEDRLNDKNLTKDGIIRNILGLHKDGTLIGQETGTDGHAKTPDFLSNIEMVCIGDKSCIAEIQKNLSGQKKSKVGLPQSFDIILLDYLLGHKQDDKGNVIGVREYGYELFPYLFKKPLKEKRPLMGKFWIMNISSFDTAMTDRIREQGYTFNNEVWNMSRGGDPVNTPELFQYMLLRMMEMQINQALSWSEEFDSHTLSDISDLISHLYSVNTVKKNHSDLDGLINLDFPGGTRITIDQNNAGDQNEEEEEEEENEQYIVRFEKVAEVFATIQQLRQDSKNGSAFAKSVLIKLKDQQEKDKLRILSHYRELLYQLSFHSIDRNPATLIEAQKLRVLLQRYSKDYI